MRLISFSILLLLGLESSSQNRRESEKTSIVITEISSNWKPDSIGRDGFRTKVFERLRYSKIDDVSKDFLLKYLGKPHHISRFYSGIKGKHYIGYRYYVNCWVDYPKERFFMGTFIEFVFDENETMLLEITDGTYCG